MRKRERLSCIYGAIKTRCYNKNHIRYANYGGRGILICEEWNNYASFKKWAILSGYSNSLTIDRIDSNLGYSPENCRWITKAENNRTQTTVLLSLEKASEIRSRYSNGGITQKQLAEMYGTSEATIRDVIKFRSWKDLSKEVPCSRTR